MNTDYTEIEKRTVHAQSNHSYYVVNELLEMDINPGSAWKWECTHSHDEILNA